MRRYRQAVQYYVPLLRMRISKQRGGTVKPRLAMLLGKEGLVGEEAVHYKGDDGIYDVGQFCSQQGRKGSGDGKAGRDGHKNDIGKAQRNAKCQCQAHPAFALAYRERNANERQDICRKESGNPLV